ncbi:SpoIVB peptidase [Salibacterium salarium]|uniref:SpoIVB peptidase n=1 Tax=Salibacterium salarium TaxID=284579 RepID=A0A3R9PN81_9BACI|nr:SpoIVB peptidase [Salibacterium salarium]RSL34572.1 SpoIVB peptidase [Salibacterium salarium]
MKWGRRLTGILVIALFTFVLLNDGLQSYMQIPEQITMFESDTTNVAEKMDIKSKENINVLENNEDTNVSLKVTGFPKKQTNIEKIPDLKVIPGGDSIGVKLQSDGVMVVGFHQILSNEQRFSPAKKAGLKVGDRIIEMNGKKMNKLEDVVEELKNKDIQDSLSLKYMRKSTLHETQLTPHEKKDSYVLGAYIRNAASGVGTLTFYEPEDGKFGALGHVIADSDTKKPVVVENGTIMRSSVGSIQRGVNGNPGEKQATLDSDEQKLGNVTKNSSFGVFGHLEENKLNESNNDYNKPMSVGFAQEVETGPAKMLTVIEDEKVESFDIEIVQTMPQLHAASKGMVIKVKDEELLEKTGGIIQGMSGSPIIQKGKIVGAVTHVFVNDATSGYACHIEWMLEEAGINTFLEKRTQKAS